MTVFGEVDIANADDLRRSLMHCARSDRPLTVDLTACGYIDTSGLHVLAEFGQLMPRLSVLSPAKGHIPRVIELLGLSHLVEVVFQPELT
ncbi:MAG: STAS domain-containing protein [Candidatus Eremiobacteraeota bacterium]|nr:STAS domain-containing protein [Candidatus Eremiobacteraeota bacterium]